MRSNATGNDTLLKIQQEINEVAARENELRHLHSNTNGIIQNGTHDHNQRRNSTSMSPTPPSPPSNLDRNMSMSMSNINSPSTTNRRFIPNSQAKGIMQKFYKSRGKLDKNDSLIALGWRSLDGPPKVLLPRDKPLRRGYVPVEERIQKELQEMKNREEELRTERRKSQLDLLLALSDHSGSNVSSRSVSPLPFRGKLRHATSFNHLLDDHLSDAVSPLASLKPAKSLTELCDTTDGKVESTRSLIQQWEDRIKQLKNT